MEELPCKLVDLLKTILKDNVISSWRIQSFNNLTLSIRFESHIGQYGNTTDMTYMDRQYRSKPPSCVVRDNARQQEWYHRKISEESHQVESGVFSMSQTQDDSIKETSEQYAHSMSHVGASTPQPVNIGKANHNATNREDQITPQAERHNPNTLSDAIVEHGVTLVDTATNTHKILNENEGTQTIIVPHFNASCQVSPDTKRRKCQTKHECHSMHTQTWKQTRDGQASQTEYQGIDKHTSMRQIKLKENAVITDSLLTASCHVQTCEYQKTRGTQYKIPLSCHDTNNETKDAAVETMESYLNNNKTTYTPMPESIDQFPMKDNDKPVDITATMSVNVAEMSYIDDAESDKAERVSVSKESGGTKCWSELSGMEKKAIRDRQRESNRKFLEKINFHPKASKQYGSVT